MIKVCNLKKSFGNNLVLKGIDYEIHKNEKIVVIGPSGSGKSTFLRCLNLLEIPTEGEIWFDGKRITDKKTDINEVRKHMGMVFQHFGLFPHMTIVDNVAFPLKMQGMATAPRRARAVEVLELVGLGGREDARPHQLSGG